MKPADPNAEVMATERLINNAQNIVHEGVRLMIETHDASKWLVPACDALAGAAADPVSLRAGINAGNADQGALVALLISLDVITLEQYQRARLQAINAEVEAYETALRQRLAQAVPLAVKPETEKGETDDV